MFSFLLLRLWWFIGNPLVGYAAAVAYCFLVIGVVLQAFSYLKNKPCEEDAFGREC
jgi:hypothetical protein